MASGRCDNRGQVPRAGGYATGSGDRGESLKGTAGEWPVAANEREQNTQAWGEAIRIRNELRPWRD
jgi:hypothetical protein